MRRARQVTGSLLLAAAVALTGVTEYHDHPERQTPAVFSRNALLAGLWEKYTAAFVSADGRVADPAQNGRTTSEGQGYALLRAVWEDDRPTFDRVWSFTRSALARPHDHLLSWEFGRRADGSYGVLVDQGGSTTASDADTDVGLALVMAYARWQQGDYLRQAYALVSDIWRQEVVDVGGVPVLAADDLEKNAPQVVVNPSYLAPYAYRVFATVDTAHPWRRLVSSSYDLLARVTGARGAGATGLPPDWLRLDRRTGALVGLTGGLDGDYGYDALRVPWRLALDYRWNAEPRAAALLRGMGFLGERWRAEGRLAATYGPAGQPAGYESAATYGAAVGYFAVADRADLGAVYHRKLAVLYDPDTQAWRTPLGYYEDNWAWFGIALEQDALPDLARDLPS